MSKSAAAFATIGLVFGDIFIANTYHAHNSNTALKVFGGIAASGIALGFMRYMCTDSPRLYSTQCALLKRADHNPFSRGHSVAGILATVVACVLTATTLLGSKHAELAQGFGLAALNHWLLGVLAPVMIDYLRERRKPDSVFPVVAITRVPCRTPQSRRAPARASVAALAALTVVGEPVVLVAGDPRAIPVAPLAPSQPYPQQPAATDHWVPVVPRRRTR